MMKWQSTLPPLPPMAAFNKPVQNCYSNAGRSMWRAHTKGEKHTDPMDYSGVEVAAVVQNEMCKQHKASTETKTLMTTNTNVVMERDDVVMTNDDITSTSASHRCGDASLVCDRPTRTLEQSASVEQTQVTTASSPQHHCHDSEQQFSSRKRKHSPESPEVS